MSTEFKTYVSGLVTDPQWSVRQHDWFASLKVTLDSGEALYAKADAQRREMLASGFRDWVRTEEIKAWYGEPEGNSLFQGTSVSSLTIPCIMDVPLELTCIDELEEAIAKNYIRLHDAHEATVRRASIESIDKWMAEGLFFGVVIASKLISQAFQLSVPYRDLVFRVGDTLVDPHQILRHPDQLRSAYFAMAKERIDCLADLDLTQREFEQCLVLADISKPKIELLKGRLILGPVRCNEIAARLSRNVTKRIHAETAGRISPRSLMVTIYDTDTPYTYHQVSGYSGHCMAPVLPGLVVLGSSGTVDAFRWLYAYRCSLISQKIMKSSLWSEVEGRFIPFVFFGVLVERDAEILLDLDNLGMLRYPGMISPLIEYTYLLPKLDRSLPTDTEQKQALQDLNSRLDLKPL